MKFHYSHEIAKFLLTRELVAAVKELTEYFKNKEEYTSTSELAKKFLSLSKKKKIDVKRKHVTSGSAKVFSLDKKTIVKIGGISDLEYKVFFPKKSIPTVVVITENNEGRILLFRIQPMAAIDHSSRELAYKALSEMSRKYVGDDCHDGNVGIYKNEPVVFDW